MRREHRVLVFLNWFCVGLTSPILSLLLLGRGLTLSMLALVMAVYSAVTIVLEVPSGVFADLCGRKKTFLLSCAMYFLSALALFLWHGLGFALAAMTLRGVARAFSSGSLDAMLVETGGPEAIEKTTASLAVWQSAGIAVGALAGGFLPNWREYSGHLLGCMAFLLLTGLLAANSLHEPSRKKGERATIGRFIRQGQGLLRSSGAIRMVLLCIVVSSVAVVLLETYWQPQLRKIEPNHFQIFAGVMSALGYGATTLGSSLAGRFHKHGKERWAAYILPLAGFTASVFLLAFLRLGAIFAATYVAAYFFLGFANVSEQTILHLRAPDALRASVLSASSLALQVGGVLTSVASAILVGRMGMTGLWIAGAGLATIALGVCFAKVWRRVPEGETGG